MNSSIRSSTQRGATLFIALVMLVVLTLLSISGIRMNMTNLRIAGNMQWQGEATAAAQQAIEQKISDLAFLSGASSATAASTVSIDVNRDGTNDYTVTVSAPACYRLKPQTGYSMVVTSQTPGTSQVQIAPDDVYFDIQGQVTDNNTGGVVTVHQGIKVVLGGKKSNCDSGDQKGVFQ